MFLWALLFLVLALIVLPYTSLLQASLSRNPGGITREMAQKFVEDDARNAFGDDAIVSTKTVTQSGDSWKAEVEIELEPHSACPKLLRRHYSLMPLLFVEERLVTSCEPRKPLGHRVEAIIAYASATGKPAGYYCAFKLPFSMQEAVNYCGAVEPSSVEAFAQSLEGAKWVIAFKDGETTRLAALDDYANVLATH